MPLREAIKGVPFLGSAAKLGYYLLAQPLKHFPGSQDYWQRRYEAGGVSSNGNQLAMLDCLRYLGVDISDEVIYHLREDPVYNAHMPQLFNASSRLVAIYSSNTDERRLFQHIQHKYPYCGNDRTGSFADFYFFEKTTSPS